MKHHTLHTVAAVALILPLLGIGLIGCSASSSQDQQSSEPSTSADIPNLDEWEVHSMERPNPEKITPATASTQEEAGQAPSDAVVLFDGKDLSEWQTPSGDPAPWKVENGYFEVVPGTGTIQTKKGFGDVQLHIEWQAPNPPKGEGQDRGNSGVFFMDGRYEVQVLDSYNSDTYADGQASALYGQYPPAVNATREPGKWQTYDIIFQRPRFDANGNVTEPARVTVLHNGVLTQNNRRLTGPTGHHARPPYEAHADALPIALQDHDHPVRFRNVWLRNLE